MIIYLAGAETWIDSFIGAGINNVLFSFYYMRSMRKFAEMWEAVEGEQARRKEVGEQPMRLFLDSGGFTYLNSDGAKPPAKKYFKDYLRFVEDTKDMWDVVAELDIDVPGTEITSLLTADWREDLRAASGRDNILTVYHDWITDTIWRTWCEDERYPYLAVGSGTPMGVANKLCNIAHRNNTLVHGFAETKFNTDLKYMKYDSVDSSTWLRATKYGGFFVFQNNKLRVLDHKHKADRRLFKRYFETNGIDLAKIMAEDQAELTKASLIAWKNLGARYENVGKGGAVKPKPRDGEEVVEVAKPKRAKLLPQDQEAMTISKPKKTRTRLYIDRGSATLTVKQDGRVVAKQSRHKQLTQPGWSKYVQPDSPETFLGLDGLPWAIQARNGGHDFTDREVRNVNEIGARLGCHTCGSPEPKTREGNWVKDHYPDNSKAGEGPQCLLPQCKECSNAQGGKAKIGSSKYYKPELLEKGPIIKVSAGQAIAYNSPTQDIPSRRAKERDGASTIERDTTIETTGLGADTPIGTDAARVGTDIPHSQPVARNESIAPLDGDNTALQSANSDSGHKLPIYAAEEALLDELPKLGCSSCAMQGECPEFEEGAVCYFEKHFKALPVRDVNSHKAIAGYFLAQEVERTHRAILLERLTTGGQIDPRVSQQQVALRRAMQEYRELDVHRAVPPSFSASVTMQGAVPGGAGGQGILASIFGSSLSPEVDTMDNDPGARTVDEPGGTQEVIDVPSLPES